MADQVAVGVMTLATGAMRRCIDQGIRMTRCTVVRICCGYDRAVIRCRRMQRAPVTAVTRRAVTARAKALAVGAVRRYQ